MVDSDKSDNGETLQTTGKRSREDDSGDEKCELPSKRPCGESPELAESVDSKKNSSAQVVNGGALVLGEETVAVRVENERKNGETVDTKDDKIIVEKEPMDESNEGKIIVQEENLKQIKTKPDVQDDKSEKVDIEEEEKDAEQKETDKEEPIQDRSNDSEVVDGLELSVECASDKEASSSESDKEKDTRPRPKTIIVKAKPNDSELEVGSSEPEKSEVDEKGEENEGKSKKQRIGKRKSPIAKKSSSHSEESLESNSDDEDYSPNGKKKLKKTVSPKKTTPQRNKSKNESDNKKKSVTESENEKSESDDEEMSLADRARKINKTRKSTSNAESSDNGASSNYSDERNNGKRQSKKADPREHKKIKALRKYLNVAGIHVKYDTLWIGCKNIKQRADRLKELLKEKGIEGRPTLEKCKRLKKKNTTIKEIAELDTSNIISEGRVTRSRRIEAKKLKMESSPTHREARNLFKRIQPVCDSDSE